MSEQQNQQAAEEARDAAKRTVFENLQRLNEAVGMAHPEAIEAGFDYGFNEGWEAGYDAEVTPYREALRALVEAARSMELELLKVEPQVQHEFDRRAVIELNLRTALAGAAALLEEK